MIELRVWTHKLKEEERFYAAVLSVCVANRTAALRLWALDAETTFRTRRKKVSRDLCSCLKRHVPACVSLLLFFFLTFDLALFTNSLKYTFISMSLFTVKVKVFFTSFFSYSRMFLLFLGGFSRFGELLVSIPDCFYRTFYTHVFIALLHVGFLNSVSLSIYFFFLQGRLFSRCLYALIRIPSLLHFKWVSQHKNHHMNPHREGRNKNLECFAATEWNGAVRAITWICINPRL